MRRKNIVIGAIMMFTMVGMLSGCGGKKDDTKDNSAEKKLTIWTNMEVEAETIQLIADEWGKEKGYDVDVIHESPDVQQFAQATKSTSGPDAVIGIPNDQLANYVNAGLSAEVPDSLYDDNDYSEAAIQACYVEGKRMAAPLAVETVTLFYNTDKIAQAPSTWEELVEAAKDKGGIQFDATSVYYDLGFLRACGGYIFNYSDGAYDVENIGLNNSGSVKAYEFINKLCSDYNFVSASVTADITRSNFQNGQTAFYIGGPWDCEGFDSAGTPYEVATMPKFNDNDFVTPVGTQVSFVSSKSNNQEAAWDLIMYVIENGAMQMYEAGDRIPAKLSEQENEEIQKDEVSAVFIEQINNGEPMPTVSEMGQLWDIHANNMKLMFTGEMTPKAAADNITSQLKEAIELMNSGK